MQQENIHQVIERAKQQRAEYIGTAIRKHPIATASIIGIPMLLVQVPWSRLAAVAEMLPSLQSVVSVLG